MKIFAIATIIQLLFAYDVSAVTGEQLLRKHFKIDENTKIDEYVVRRTMLNLTPIGSTSEEVVNALAKNGIYYFPEKADPIICYAGDEPIHCQFLSSDDQGKIEANYTADYVFAGSDGLKDIIVIRSYSNIAKEYTTNPTRPAVGIKLKNGLSVGSTIGEFDVVYEEKGFNFGHGYAVDWPLSVLYFDKTTKTYFFVGVEIGDMSMPDVINLEQDRIRLRKFKAGIIYSAK